MWTLVFISCCQFIHKFCIRKKQNWQPYFFNTMEKRAACVVIACCLLIHVTVIGSDVILYHTAGKITTIIYLIVQGVVYLLYPFLGWLSDVYITRYRSVLFSFIIMIVASVPMMLAGTFICFNTPFAFLCCWIFYHFWSLWFGAVLNRHTTSLILGGYLETSTFSCREKRDWEEVAWLIRATK